jgi:radical SAM superfamily enzyme YgiQ (UPF0313 family)
MKIMLIVPPDKNTVVMEAPNEVYEEFGSYPPLGLMYIAACIKEKSNHEVRIMDCDTDKLNFQQIEQNIRDYSPDVVGVTSYTPIIYDSLRIMKITKKVNSKIITVMGGHHSDIYPIKTIKLGNIDYILKGESEYTFLDLLDAIKGKKSIEDVKGVVFKKDNKITNTEGYGFVENLDELPLPRRELIDWKKHQCVLGREKYVATIMSSRGCPYRCTFCYKPLDSISYRMRSAKNIIKEIEQCYNLGLREIFFFDDNFSVNTKRVEEICDEIIKRKLKITWSFRGRVNTINYPMLKKCKKAGCHRIHFGVETGTDKGLKKIKKDITTDMVKKAFKLCKKAGITTVSNFIIGLPGETKEDMFKTVKFANEINTNYAEFQILTPYPKTELYEEMIKNGVFNDFWKEFAENPTPDFKLRTCNEHYTREELFDLLEQCLKKFYFTPKRIAKLIFQIRSKKELKTKIKAGLALLNFHKMVLPKGEKAK